MNLPSNSLKIEGPVVSGSKQVFIVKGTVHYPELTRLRKRFESRILAQTYISSLDNEYLNDLAGGEQRFTRISFQEEQEYFKFKELINRLDLGYNVSLIEVGSIFAQNYKDKTHEQVTLEDAIELYRDELTNVRQLTYKHIRGTLSRLTRFQQAWSGEKTFVHEFSHNDLKSWIYSRAGDKLSPWSFKNGHRAKGEISKTERRNEYAALSGFFNFCFVDLEATAEKVIDKVSAPTAEKPPPKAYTPEQARDIIEAAVKLEELIALGGPKAGRKINPGTKVVPYFALGLFSALRPDEVKRLDWESFNWNESGKVEVTVTGKGVKGTAKYRTITLPETCVEWIKPYRRKSGPVAPHYAIKNVQRVFAIAGWRVPPQAIAKTKWPELSELTGDPHAEGKVQPIHDGLRHTAVTYRLKVIEDDRKVGLWAGHSPDVQHSHYKALATEGQAQAFWRILPAGVRWQDVIKEKETREFLEKAF